MKNASILDANPKIFGDKKPTLHTEKSGNLGKGETIGNSKGLAKCRLHF